MKILLSILLAFVTTIGCMAQQSEVYIKNKAAIDGYDVVAYFTQAKAVKGDAKLKYQWNNATWYFSSDENLNLFKTNPEKYAPQYGGYCAYGMSEGHKAPTDPQAWTIVGGKLYFNYNMNAKTSWLPDTTNKISLANQNWLVQKDKP